MHVPMQVEQQQEVGRRVAAFDDLVDPSNDMSPVAPIREQTAIDSTLKVEHDQSEARAFDSARQSVDEEGPVTHFNQFEDSLRPIKLVMGQQTPVAAFDDLQKSRSFASSRRSFVEDMDATPASTKNKPDHTDNRPSMVLTQSLRKSKVNLKVDNEAVDRDSRASDQDRRDVAMAKQEES